MSQITGIIWPHHAPCCEHIGGAFVKQSPVDFYRCGHGGIKQYLARSGPAPGDYISVPLAGIATVATMIELPILQFLLLISAVDTATHGSLAQGFALIPSPVSGNMVCIASPLISELELAAFESAAQAAAHRFIHEPFTAALAMKIEGLILGHLSVSGIKRWASPMIDVSQMTETDQDCQECPPAGGPVYV